jgi:site-specific DNA-cytosine methylase
MAHPPQYVLVENVIGFERSATRAALVAALSRQRYHIREFVLTPQQFGVPYSRPRYFCLARTRPFASAVSEDAPCMRTPAELVARVHRGAGEATDQVRACGHAQTPAAACTVWRAVNAAAVPLHRARVRSCSRCCLGQSRHASARRRSSRSGGIARMGEAAREARALRGALVPERARRSAAQIAYALKSCSARAL